MMRNSISLNGIWNFAPVYHQKCLLEIPHNITYENEIIVPSIWRYVMPNGRFKVREFEPFNLHNYPKEWADAETGVYNRKFIVPQSMENHRIFLKFNGIMLKSRIYLNGVSIADWNEAYLPLKIDVTDFIRVGDNNDLTVVCTSFEKTVIASGEEKITDLRGHGLG